MAIAKKKSRSKRIASLGIEALAVNGGKKAVIGFKGVASPKIGVAEFMALAEMWGYNRETLKKMRKLVEQDADGLDPHLARYYNPKPSRVERLETLAKKVFGSKYALGVNSGTSALNAAYVAAGIGPGDEVIVPGFTFFATVAAVVTARALPVIAEVNESLTLDPDDVERKITPRTKAIVPVHMSGWCADMGRIMKLARKHKLTVIEDTAQCCGGSYKGKMLGSIGHLGCFSLSSYKLTGAGEAGLLLTNDEWLYTRAQNQHDTAACWRPDRYAKERKAGELFCGQNYRMSELEGAVNLVQLKKNKSLTRQCNRNMQRILKALKPFRDTRPRPSNDIDGDIGYKLALFAKDAPATMRIVEALQAEGVPASGRGAGTARDWHMFWYWEQILEKLSATPEGCPFTCPYHEGPLPEYSEEMCPTTRDLLGRAVFINVYPWWTAADCKAIATAINKVCATLG